MITFTVCITRYYIPLVSTCQLYITLSIMSLAEDLKTKRYNWNIFYKHN